MPGDLWFALGFLVACTIGYWVLKKAFQILLDIIFRWF